MTNFEYAVKCRDAVFAAHDAGEDTSHALFALLTAILKLGVTAGPPIDIKDIPSDDALAEMDESAQSAFLLRSVAIRNIRISSMFLPLQDRVYAALMR